MSGCVLVITYWVLGLGKGDIDHGRSSAGGRGGVGCQSSGVGKVHGCHCDGEEEGSNQCQDVLLERHCAFVLLDLLLRTNRGR